MKRCRCSESFYIFSTDKVYYYIRIKEPYIMKNNVWYLKEEEVKKRGYEVVYEVMLSDGDKEFFTEKCFNSSFIDIKRERRDKIVKISGSCL